jgi:hypothetical protein
VSVIAEVYRENKKRRREAHKRPRKANDSLGLNISLTGKNGEESRVPIHSHCDWHICLKKILSHGRLENISKRCGEFLAHIFQRKLKNALSLPFFAFIRRHGLGLSVKHTESEGSGPKTEPTAIGPNTLTFHMTYIV